MEKKVILIRHGETLFNEKNMIQGWCDSPLTERGIAQARNAGLALQQLHLNHPSFYTSPTGRAVETMEYIAAQPYHRHPGLKEMNFGRLEGESCSILPLNDHKGFMNSFLPFQGEGPEDVHNRMYQTITEILANDPADTIVCVSHGVAIEEFVRYYAGLKFEDFNWANCAFHIVKWKDGQFTYEQCLSDHCL